MTMLAQHLTVSAVVVAALGYLLQRLWRRLRADRQVPSAGARPCRTCSGCGSCPAAHR